MLEDKTLPHDAPVLVLANKADMKEALQPKEIADIMRLKEIKRLYSIHKTCALNGEGIETAIQWIASIIKTKMDNVKTWAPWSYLASTYKALGDTSNFYYDVPVNSEFGTSTLLILNILKPEHDN